MKKSLPKFYTTIGKVAHCTFPDGSKMKWEIIDEIIEEEYYEKKLILQRMKNNNEEMIRFGYYIIDKNGHWGWGQYAPFISSKHFSKIIKKAKEKGWFK